MMNDLEASRWTSSLSCESYVQACSDHPALEVMRPVTQGRYVGSFAFQLTVCAMCVPQFSREVYKQCTCACLMAGFNNSTG